MPKKIKASMLIGILAFVLLSCGDNRDSSLQPTASIEQPTLTATLFPVGAIPTCVELTCWNGIVLGATTQAEASVLLEARYGQENVTEGNAILEWMDTGQDGESDGGWLYFTAEGTVSQASAGFSKESPTVAELIARFGEPSHVWVARAFSSEVQCAGSLLAFVDIGLLSWLRPDIGFVGVRPNQSVSELMWMPPSSARAWAITDHAKLDWQGYDDYCLIAWPNTPNIVDD